MTGGLVFFSSGIGGSSISLRRLHPVDDLFVRLDHPERGVFLVPVVELRVAHGLVGGDRLLELPGVVERVGVERRELVAALRVRVGGQELLVQLGAGARTASCTPPASWCPSGSPATWSCRPAPRRGRWSPRSAARPRRAAARPRAPPGCPCCAGTSRSPWCTSGRAARAPWRPPPGCGPSRRRGRCGPGRAARRSSTATSTAAPCRRRSRRCVLGLVEVDVAEALEHLADVRLLLAPLVEVHRALQAGDRRRAACRRPSRARRS